MRDKLIELIEAGRGCPDDRAPFLDEHCLGCRYYDEKNCDIVRLADHLLAHGVTLAEDTNVGDKKPLTNGDRIRAMTDEELVEWVVFQTGYRESAFSTVTYYNILTGNDDNRKDAEKAMYTWLKRPVEEET